MNELFVTVNLTVEVNTAMAEDEHFTEEVHTAKRNRAARRKAEKAHKKPYKKADKTAAAWKRYNGIPHANMEYRAKKTGGIDGYEDIVRMNELESTIKVLNTQLEKITEKIKGLVECEIPRPLTIAEENEIKNLRKKSRKLSEEIAPVVKEYFAICDEYGYYPVSVACEASYWF